MVLGFLLVCCLLMLDDVPCFVHPTHIAYSTLRVHSNMVVLYVLARMS